MPELPEVETIRIGLNQLLPGRTVVDIWHDWDKGFPNARADIDKYLIGSKIVAVARRAKVLLIELDTKYSLMIHLKMTGQLVFRGREQFGAGHPNKSLIGPLPDSSTRVIIEFKDGSKLFFNDQRKFGWVRLIPTTEINQIDFMKKLGPEPLAKDFSSLVFKKRLLLRPKSAVKAVLLDQAVLAGVGNIYADESLWAAKIHPSQLVRDIPNSKFGQLYRGLIDVLELSIAKGGSTDRNYVDAEGKKGSYLTFAKVFRREGQACQRCGHTIIKIRVAGRGTHICPNCQRLKK